MTIRPVILGLVVDLDRAVGELDVAVVVPVFKLIVEVEVTVLFAVGTVAGSAILLVEVGPDIGAFVAGVEVDGLFTVVLDDAVEIVVAFGLIIATSTGFTPEVVGVATVI